MMRNKYLRLITPTHNYSPKQSSAGLIPGLLIIFVLLFLCVWMSSQAVKFNYEINENMKTRDRLKTNNRTLEIKLQSMTSGEGIAAAAKEKYGFKAPADGQVQILKKERNLFERLFKFPGNKDGKL
jgi:cell division protein FtsL